LCNLMA